MPTVQSDLVARSDLDEAIEPIKTELVKLRADMGADMQTLEGRLRADMQSLEGRLRGDMQAMESRLHAGMDAWGNRLSGELRQHVTAAMEESRTWFKVLDEKWTSRVDDLRTDFEAHRADESVHRRPRRRSSR